eukprot:TRINITY_DN52911_c0_g1_i1.p2 TRINITY_DN52911_c0_g1~~TRINITY_DN52911_c0_g1_i1.p2  ORF type:complete len:113 (-),score=5.06 TRINITY_DN52911_c0_g1_i1:71-409(-)
MCSYGTCLRIQGILTNGGQSVVLGNSTACRAIIARARNSFSSEVSITTGTHGFKLRLASAADPASSPAKFCKTALGFCAPPNLVDLSTWVPVHPSHFVGLSTWVFVQCSCSS